MHSTPDFTYPGSPQAEHFPRLRLKTGPMTGLSFRLWHDGRSVPVEGGGG